MCGIYGWITKDRLRDTDAAIDVALATLQHRGPDGEGRWLTEVAGTGEQLCLAHRRLAIIDALGGAQPFHSHDDRFVLTYNGEIYNFVELRAELVALGHRFTTVGDTEVVVESYRRWGEEAFARFRGMFALALFDRATQRLVLARDHVGKKPLFIASLPTGFVFASEIGALLSHPHVDRSIRLDQIGNYIAQRYIDGPDTFYAAIRKLQPGTYLVHERGADSQHRYYTNPLDAPTRSAQWTMAESAERLSAGLREAVRIRMRSDAPYGLFLSGGLDSSVLLALMTEIGGRPVNTFSVGFASDRNSELDNAALTARDFGAVHQSLTVGAEEFSRVWQRAIDVRGAPVSEASDLAILILANAASRSVKMVLTGEGADELLAGYPKYWGEDYIRRYHRAVPSAVHRALICPLIAALPPRYERLKILSRSAAIADPARRARQWFASGDSAVIARLAVGDLRKQCRPLENVDPGSSVRTLQRHDFAHWLPDNLLERGDRMMMAGSIEGRMPFMDTELIDLVARMPVRHLLDGRVGKSVLRNVARPLIRKELLSTPKIGFTVPIGGWFRTTLSATVRDLLSSGQSNVRQLLSARELDRTIAAHLSGRRDHAKLLWSLTNLELFLRSAGKTPGFQTNPVA